MSDARENVVAVDRVGTWQRKSVRERRGRKAAEELLERMSSDLLDSQCVLAAQARELEQRVEELEQARIDAETSSAAKTLFLANMSHEIRTPLNGAIGTLELLRDTGMQPEQQKLVDTIMRCVDTLLELINSVLDTSKMDAGQVNLVSEPCDLRQIVVDGVELFRAAATNKHVRLEAAISADHSPWIQGDPIRIKQIVNNLIGNAVKFTSEGSIDVQLSLATLGVGHVAVTIQVADTGPGIASANHERVFAEFEQVDGSTSRQTGGTGLGLAIARKLARLMGGDITLQSEHGKGATFTLALLAREAEPVGVVEPGDEVDKLEDLRVLVVDDNAQNRIVAARMLAKMGCRVASVESGPMALQALQGRDFDLVLLDGQMPVMSGDQVARVIRDPKSQVRDHDIPILCVTADVIAERLQHYLASGMDAVLTKPFRKAGLQRAVIGVMAKARQA